MCHEVSSACAKREVCESHADSQDHLLLSGGIKKPSLLSDRRSVVIFTFHFQSQENTFQHLSLEKSNNFTFRFFFFTPRLFAGDNLSPSRAFDVGVESNITSDCRYLFSSLQPFISLQTSE